MPFRDQDWSRLKKIAEGNPDESKIGGKSSNSIKGTSDKQFPHYVSKETVFFTILSCFVSIWCGSIFHVFDL